MKIHTIDGYLSWAGITIELRVDYPTSGTEIYYPLDKNWFIVRLSTPPKYIETFKNITEYENGKIENFIREEIRKIKLPVISDTNLAKSLINKTLNYMRENLKVGQEIPK